MLEVVILLMTYPVKFVFQTKTDDLNLSVSYMITGINEPKALKTMYANVSVDLMEENVIQINGKITINVSMSVKSVMYVKKVMFGILLHVPAKM